MHLWTISQLTLREAGRRKIVTAAIVLGALFLTFFNLGYHFIKTELNASPPAQQVINNQMFNFIVTSGLYAANFLAVAMGALVSADTLAGEITSGTIQSLAAKPVRRAEIVLGKWLGFAVLLIFYVLGMAGGVILSAWAQSGYQTPNALPGIALIYFESLLVMTITVACSSVFSTLATGGTVFGLYGLAVIGGWVEQIGAFVKNQTAVDIGILASLLIPSEALWRRAAFEMTSPLLLAMGGMSPFVSSSVPSPLMVVYAGLYLLAALGLAVWQFNRRDL